jgi:Cysteine rich repeat
MAARILILLAALLGADTIAMAQSGTAEEQAACRPDVRRFCFRIHNSEGANAYLQCLQEHRSRLSDPCRAVLESHGV